MTAPESKRKASMHSRKVRVPAPGVPVRMGQGTGELVNVSLTGALIELDREFVVDETLQLRVGPIEIDSRVVRCNTTASPSHLPNEPRWLVAVAFLDLAKATEKLIRDLVVDMSRRGSRA